MHPFASTPLSKLYDTCVAYVPAKRAQQGRVASGCLHPGGGDDLDSYLSVFRRVERQKAEARVKPVLGDVLCEVPGVLRTDRDESLQSCTLVLDI